MSSKIFTAIMFLLFLGTACSNGTNEQNANEQTENQSSMTTTPFGGLALYSLRDTLDKNPKAVLKEVASIGYQYIESAGYADGKYYGMTPSEFKAFLQEVGLTPMSTHHGNVTLDNADTLIAYAKEVGFKYFVIPIPPMGHFKVDEKTRALGMSEEVETISNIINTIAEKCAAAGLSCLYHNHDMEFKANKKGIVPMDYFIEHSNPAHLNFQIDLYWAVKAGVDPIAYFNKAPGRFKSWHVKDMDAQGRFAPVGTGSINFAEILKHKDQAGLEYYFVEQDVAFDQTPLEAVTISHTALSEIGFK
ncbi:MAG: sugar phosphate isomerase/epimerase [Saprospiraceae bacterium]